MKVLLFAPNAGLSWSTGGGTGVGLRLADVLLEAGHSVTLAGFHALDLAALDRMHGTDVARHGALVQLRRARGFDRAFDIFRRLPVKLSAYNGLAAPAFARWIERTLETTDAERIVFQDDVPVSARRFVEDRPPILYVHYPFRGLGPRWIPPLRSVLTGTEWANDRLLQRLTSRIIVPDPGEFADAIWTNSTITERVVASVWPTSRPSYAPTYLDPSPPPGPKAPLVLAVGAIQPAKNYELLLEAFARALPELGGWRLILAGHARDARYAQRLRSTIRGLGLTGRAAVEQDVPRPQLARWEGTARIQVHPAVFEPFGLALLEGMARGAIGVANRTEYAGGWVDILERGRFGLGFGSAEELAERLVEVATDDALAADYGRRARSRSEAFSRDRLRSTVLPHFR